MINYLIIDKQFNGIRLKDTITNNAVIYYGYTLQKAIKEHRKHFNLKYKHLEKIYISY